MTAVDHPTTGPVIGGVTTVGAGARREIINPATEDVVAVVHDSDTADVDAAVVAAAAAAEQAERSSGAQRARQLHQLADIVMANLDDLSSLLTAEQGKPLGEARLEIDRFALNLRYYAGLAALPDGDVMSRIAPEVRGDVLRVPLGVCAAIVPWNFPIGLLGNKLGPALATGNAVIVKPAETTPLTTIRIAELACSVLPTGLINVVTGGAEVGAQLVEHPGIPKVAFTGSTATGQAIARAAATRLKRLTLELGGSDPMIVLPDADLAAAARGVATGRFFNCGQVCVATKRVFVVGREAHDSFVNLVAQRVGRLTVGNGMAGVMVGPLHSAAVLDRFDEQVDDALRTGHVAAQAAIPGGPGFFAAPLVVTGVDAASSVFREEVFGPLLPVSHVDTIAEAIEAANSTQFALGASVWGGDVHQARGVAEALRSGYAWINSTQRVHRELPFGGLGLSGHGREHGVDALKDYSQTRTFIYPAPSTAPVDEARL